LVLLFVLGAPLAIGLARQAQSAADSLSQSAASHVLSVARKLSALYVWREPESLAPSQDAQRIAKLSGKVAAMPSASAKPSAPGKAPPRGSEPRPSKEKRAAPKLPKAVGVLVRRKRVIAAANAGIRPSGAPVAATSYRPAGMALIGVSGLGVGLRDGDILTRAGGTPARSDGAVVMAVTAALRRKAPAITAEVWRGIQRIIVTVELPKLVRDKSKKGAVRKKVK